MTAQLPEAPLHPADPQPDVWWRHAVIYQIYPRSWADSTGNGIGDLPGITARLPYLQELGVDAVWLSPFYVSPMNDAGYDVTDHRDVDPIFGTLDDARQLIAHAHGLGLRVLVDLVPNHSSSNHPWFQEALESPPGSPQRARYLFRDGRGASGELPPNNWVSVFGGGAWTRVNEADGTPGQWYLHLFDVTQPDFDWTNPEVVAHFHEIIRFWLELGVDGFRVDVASSLVKAQGLPDWAGGLDELEIIGADGVPVRAPMWDQEGVHEIYRGWRTILDSYSGDDRILCAEAWVTPESRLARYVRADEMHQAFNFEFLAAGWDATALRSVITSSYAANDAVGAPTTWVWSNHDVVRHASRFGLADPTARPNGIGARDPQPDRELGLRRARAATALMLALPGSAYLYQGEELGLPDATQLPDEVRQDPAYLRSGHRELGRDGCRIPFPWTRDAPGFGFGPSASTWLPQPEIYGQLAADQQQGRPDSTYELYRSLLAARRERRLGIGSLRFLHDLPEGAVGFVVADSARRTTVIANLSAAPIGLPHGRVLLASGDLTASGELPPDTTVWVATDVPS